MKLTEVKYELIVDVSKDKAWGILSDYGNVGTFHAGVVSSKAINGTENIAKLGCDRECHLIDGKRKIMVQEKIIDFKDDAYYTYDVHTWKNFPLAKAHNTFGVEINNIGKTVIYQISRYRLKPSFLTWIMKGKMKSSLRDALIAYKHFMETGEKNSDMTVIKEKYKSF
ncbi:MAG: SRPBCC family protein [Bacteroidetes bacterium]|nr:SRPBCC family protein [Bacteroidota bacterium]